MRIGFIVGKNNEIHDNKELKKLVPKKFLVDCYDGRMKKNTLQLDVAIALTIKTKFPGVIVDMILPKEISLARLKKNDINYVMGYDYVSTLIQDPYVKKFVDDPQKLLDIYKHPDSKIFPPYSHQALIWNKKKYLTKFKNAHIPINPTIFVKGSVNVAKLMTQVASYKWDNFIVKPIGGCEGRGCGFFVLQDVLEEPTTLIEYFVEESETYSEYLVQQATDGFMKYGEVKSYWIDGKFNYAINAKEKPWEESIVKPETDKAVLDICKGLGNKVLKAIPKCKFNGITTTPVATRIDFVCCLHNQPKKSMAYYVNEIEEGGIAGTYTNSKGIDFPIVEVLAAAYVRKANELIK